MTSEHVIETVALTKRYGPKLALDGLELRIPRGRIHALERGRLVNMSAPDDFRARVSHWVADVPFKGPDPDSVPGLLEVQRLDGLHHYLVLDQDEDFGEFLRAAGARSAQTMPVSLDRAVNGFLAKNHAAPKSGELA